MFKDLLSLDRTIENQEFSRTGDWSSHAPGMFRKKTVEGNTVYYEQGGAAEVSESYALFACWMTRSGHQ